MQYSCWAIHEFVMKKNTFSREQYITNVNDSEYTDVVSQSSWIATTKFQETMGRELRHSREKHSC